MYRVILVLRKYMIIIVTNIVYWESFMKENFSKSPTLTYFVRKHSQDHPAILRLPDITNLMKLVKLAS